MIVKINASKIDKKVFDDNIVHFKPHLTNKTI